MHPQRRWLAGTLLSSVVLASAFVAARASAQPGSPRTDAGSPSTPNDDLVRQGARLLDQSDLVQRGGSLLPQPRKRAPKDAGSDAAPAGDGGGSEAERAAAFEAERAAAEDDGGTAAAPGADGGTAEDGGTPAAGADAAMTARADSDPETDAGAVPHGALGQFKGKRTPDNQSAMNGVTESPLAKLGIAPKAVPAVAATVAAGLMVVWTPLIKAITGILKSLLAGRLKTRAKKGKEIDEKARVIDVLGLQIRPAEIGAISVAALLYGIAVCYVLQGRKMERVFVFRQEMLVLAIYQARSAVRFAYERISNLKTQFRFWPGGGFLCLASAYLGSALGTVGGAAAGGLIGHEVGKR